MPHGLGTALGTRSLRGSHRHCQRGPAGRAGCEGNHLGQAVRWQRALQCGWRWSRSGCSSRARARGTRQTSPRKKRRNARLVRVPVVTMELGTRRPNGRGAVRSSNPRHDVQGTHSLAGRDAATSEPRRAGPAAPRCTAAGMLSATARHLAVSGRSQPKAALGPASWWPVARARGSQAAAGLSAARARPCQPASAAGRALRSRLDALAYPPWRCHVASGLRHRDTRRNARSYGGHWLRACGIICRRLIPR